ncbi:DUF3800 domain-containing protein [Desulfoluna spongiiphila]|uniref:DUF3800 domain-containing protein n=1 Tax=Desulfoluna spongiiphila TaxID=419481 RepID=UPI001259C347|nr:DUF3800 domain-containing protein [Desulfoluna spongiiphila]VVS94439.1 protein of unknown function duf3800 [Desulfoluna spongiiphila]
MSVTKFAYIDESGTPIIGDQRFYVITASICESCDLHEIESKIKDIQKNHCSGAELKSSRIGKNKRIRKQILQDLSELPIYYFSLVVDKNNIKKDSGLQWRTSMYKYCQRMLFDRIYKNLQSIKVICDTYGRTPFMESFETYIYNHFTETLFCEKEVCYSSPDDEILIQLSDFVGGSVRRCFESKDKEEETLIHIKEKVIGIHKWPLSYQEISYGEEDELIDIMIKNHCFSVALQFIQTTEDDLLKDVCTFLLYDYSSIDKEFICSDELLKKLKHQGIISENKQKQWFMSRIIAPLRDAGVLIAASRDGYKIPCCREDISVFVKFVEEKSYPYLNRLVKMRESVFLGTNQKYDLVVESEKLSYILKGLRG